MSTYTIPHLIMAIGRHNPNDRLGDCVVRMLVTLTGVDYDDIVEWLTTNYNYNDKTGVVWERVLSENNNNILGKQFIPVKFHGSVAQFVSEYKYDNYCVAVNRHVFVASFGKIVDAGYIKDGRRVKFVWRVE